MDAITPRMAALLADLVLLLHVAVVAFVVLGQALFLVGGWRRWRWVRHLPTRLAHLGLMLYVALQSWLGLLCPLTVLEQALRRRASQSSYEESFIAHWLTRLLFYDAPWWQFIAMYSGFALLVLLTWWWVPPRRRGAA